MRISYKLTKKTEKFEKSLKEYIINFETTLYKMTALGNINTSILN